jgi:hypothetical protein
VARHRGTRPRYGRMAVASVSLTVTAVAALGGLGVLPSSAQRDVAPHAAAPGASGPPALEVRAYTGPPVADPTGSDLLPRSAEPTAADPTTRTPTADAVDEIAVEQLPADSGEGRRVVFSESRQRVWLVTGGQHVRRTYLVSGSAYDNLDPGTYEVYSRSEQAWGVDGSGTMRYFVRFTQGDAAAIGFHDIPVYDGKLVQSPSQLGTPLSHGCIRQRRSDARVLWRFAPLGTPVVVTT